jgi:hypothetical protein
MNTSAKRRTGEQDYAPRQVVRQRDDSTIWDEMSREP